MYELVEYNKKYEEQLIKLWVDVCVEEFGFEEWRDGMSKVEEELYENFKNYMMPYCQRIQNLAVQISKIDCLVSLAIVAVNNNSSATTFFDLFNNTLLTF